MLLRFGLGHLGLVPRLHCGAKRFGVADRCAGDQRGSGRPKATGYTKARDLGIDLISTVSQFYTALFHGMIWDP